MDEDCSKELLQAQDQAWELAFDYMTSMALRCALQLGITDIISNHDKPVTLTELVDELSIPRAKSSHLQRVMRLLVHTGFFTIQQQDQDQEAGYALTSVSKVFSKKHHLNMTPFLLGASDPVMVTPCLYIADWFHGTEPTAFEAVHGTNWYGYLGKHPDFNATYIESASTCTQLEVMELLKDLVPKLEGFKSYVDVAGGTGILAKAISEAAPHLSCTVYDLPHVIANAIEGGNVTLVAGDMFEYVPPADIILLKGVFTDWDDEESLKILKNCREAIQSKNKAGKVIIVDIVIAEKKETWSKSGKAELCLDLFLTTCGNGKQRTEIEWKKLFQEAGFTDYKITQTHLLNNSIIEVFL